MFSQVTATVGSAPELWKASLTSYGLAIALRGPFLLAAVGAALTLRRPGMKVLAALYFVGSLAALSSAMMFKGLVDAVVSSQPAFSATMPLLMIALVWSIARHATAVLAAEARAVRSRVAWMFGVSVALVGVPFVVSAAFPGVADAPIRAAIVRVFVVGMMLDAAVYAYRRSRTASRNQDALVALAVALAAIVLRQGLNALIEFDVGSGGAASVTTIIVLQSSTTVLNGVATLMAMMLEERDTILHQDALLRDTEVQLAGSRRIESLGQMAGGIAHDFANVLTVIGGGVSSARAATTIPQVIAELEDVDAAIERASALTVQLRDFAKKRPGERSVFLAEDRIRTLLPLLQRMTGASISVRLKLPSDASTSLDMDPSQFDQILLNLVVNARDAMASSGKIRIRAAAVTIKERQPGAEGLAPDQYVHLSVTDSGAGIAEDALAHIFEPFYTTKGESGTGLGLSTVRSVVQQARGRVEARSTVGEGTTFDVWLPLAA